MPSSVDIAAMARAALEDRQLCRVAGVAEIDPNTEAAAHVIALVARLRDRRGARAAARAAFLFWDSLTPPEGGQVH
jgi:hypothetical protein